MAEFSTSRGGFGVRQLLLYVAPNQAKRGIWFDTVTCKYASAQGKKGRGGGGVSIPLSGLEVTGLPLLNIAPFLTGTLTFGQITVGT